MKSNLHIRINNTLSPASQETHSKKLKASPCVSFPDLSGHFPHKKPKKSLWSSNYVAIIATNKTF